MKRSINIVYINKKKKKLNHMYLANIRSTFMDSLGRDAININFTFSREVR